MKRISVVFFLLILALSTYSQETENPWIETDLGSFRIERFWEQYAQTYVLVSYKNTTEKTYNLVVTLQAILYDAAGNMLLTNERSFYGREAPIVPGFEGVLKFPFDISGQADGVRVRIIKAQSLP